MNIDNRMLDRNAKWIDLNHSTNRTTEQSTTHIIGQSSQLTTSSTIPLTEQDDRYMNITVSEPVKQGEGMHAYISYKICTTTNRPQFSKTKFAVVRRYNDFVWLHASLLAVFPGVIVPPLPEKLLVGRFSPEFIESRRRALQLFLYRCCVHPELQHSEYFTTFLEATEDDLSNFKASVKTGNHRGRSNVFFQWFDDTVSTISSTLTSGSYGSNIEKSELDIEVEEMMTYIEGLEPIFLGLHKHAHGLTQRAREIADGLNEFGESFSSLGKTEENESLQHGLTSLGECAENLSVLSAEHAEKEALNFEEPIGDYIRIIGAVKAAIQKRNEVRGTYASAVADLESKNAALQAPNIDTATKQTLQNDALTAEQRVEDTKLEFDIVTERVIREFERFKRDKLMDFKRIMLDYIQMQIEYSKKVEMEWQNVIPRLREISVENSNSTSPVSNEQPNNLIRIQEEYIPSDGAPREVGNHNDDVVI